MAVGPLPQPKLKTLALANLPTSMTVVGTGLICLLIPDRWLDAYPFEKLFELMQTAVPKLRNDAQEIAFHLGAGWDKSYLLSASLSALATLAMILYVLRVTKSQIIGGKLFTRDEVRGHFIFGIVVCAAFVWFGWLFETLSQSNASALRLIYQSWFCLFWMPITAVGIAIGFEHAYWVATQIRLKLFL